MIDRIIYHDWGLGLACVIILISVNIIPASRNMIALLILPLVVFGSLSIDLGT